MKKTKAIILGLLTLLPFIGLAFLMYYLLQSTPMLIIILIILMAGVMLAFFVYTKNTKGITEDTNQNVTLLFPEREKNMLKIHPKKFCEKLEKYTGNLYIFGLEEAQKDITLVSGEYDRLTDKLTLKYTNGLRTVLYGTSSIAVGYNQFAIYVTEEIEVVKNTVKTTFKVQSSQLIQRNGEEQVIIKRKPKHPVYLFTWK